MDFSKKSLANDVDRAGIEATTMTRYHCLLSCLSFTPRLDLPELTCHASAV